MEIKFRPYQRELIAAVERAWAGGRANVLACQATRTGKTVVFSEVIRRAGVPAVAIAHRQELISQISVALARAGVVHRIIAPTTVIKRIIRRHVKATGRACYSPQALTGVASVDTLLRRADKLACWLAKIELWVTDEAHHITGTNKWAKAVALFPGARGLGVTATPMRADRKGLGRDSGGVFDVLIEGLQSRQAIADGWLLDHTIYAPASDYHRPDGRDLGTNGDLKRQAIVASVRNSRVTGDVVTHYQRLVPGKTAVVFAPDIETGMDLAEGFKAAGIPAAILSAKSPDIERDSVLQRFARREVLVVVNVDLFGEGTDLPDLEVVIMARPTESFSLFAQQTARASTPVFGGPAPETRAARLAAIAASAKPRAIIVDHVGNVARHATAVQTERGIVIDLAYAEWTLDAGEKGSRDRPDDVIPLRNCLNPVCMQVYERVLPECPYCGHHPEPANRSAPEFVDGDLSELDPAALIALRGAVEVVDQPVEEYRADLAAKHCPTLGIKAHAKRHLARQEAQAALRHAMALWAGYHAIEGRGQSECERRFWFAFGIDALSAQALGSPGANELRARIEASIEELKTL